MPSCARSGDAGAAITVAVPARGAASACPRAISPRKRASAGGARAVHRAAFMARLLPVALAAFSVVALSTTAGTAFADQASGNSQAAPFVGCHVAVGANGPLPSNAPALFVTDSSNQATATVTAELVSAGGRAPLGAP